MKQPLVRPPFAWLALVGLIWLVATACATASDPPSPWATWGTLRLKARSTLFSGRVEMRVTRAEGKCTLATTTIARFFGAKIAHAETLSVIDETTGRSERYENVSKKRARRYIFGQHGYRVAKLDPEGDPDRPIDEWHVRSEVEYAYPTAEDGRPVLIHDYYGMLLHLRNLDLHAPGDEAVVHVATSKGPAAFRVVVGEVGHSDQTVIDPRDGSERTLAADELRLRIIPADPDRDTEGFLKMEGETELWVEADSKTLLRLSGKVPRVPGRVRLVLSELG